jgi:hypothetical protein
MSTSHHEGIFHAQKKGNWRVCKLSLRTNNYHCVQNAHMVNGQLFADGRMRIQIKNRKGKVLTGGRFMGLPNANRRAYNPLLF